MVFDTLSEKNAVYIGIQYKTYKQYMILRISYLCVYIVYFKTYR